MTEEQMGPCETALRETEALLKLTDIGIIDHHELFALLAGTRIDIGLTTPEMRDTWTEERFQKSIIEPAKQRSELMRRAAADKENAELIARKRRIEAEERQAQIRALEEEKRISALREEVERMRKG